MQQTEMSPIHPTDPFVPVVSLLFWLELVSVVGVLAVVLFPICDKLNSADFALFMAHSSLGLILW